MEKDRPYVDQHPLPHFYLQCRTHGILAIDMALVDVSRVWDTHRETCKEEHFTFLPQSVYDEQIGLKKE